MSPCVWLSRRGLPDDAGLQTSTLTHKPMSPPRVRLSRFGLPDHAGLQTSTLTALQSQEHSQGDDQLDNVVCVMKLKTCLLNEKNGSSTCRFVCMCLCMSVCLCV